MQDPNLHAMGSCHATIPLAGRQALLGARQRARTGLTAGNNPDAALRALDGHSVRFAGPSGSGGRKIGTGKFYKVACVLQTVLFMG